MTVRREGPEGRRRRTASPGRTRARNGARGRERLWIVPAVVVVLVVGITTAVSRRDRPNDLSGVIAEVDYATSDQFPDGSYEGVAVHVPDIYAAREDTLRVTAEVRDGRVVRVEAPEPGAVLLGDLEPARLDTDGLATFDVPPRGMMNVRIGPGPTVRLD